MYNLKQSKKALYIAGFTLAEMVVVIGIMAIIMSVVIFNHADFNDNLALTNDVQEIEFTLREAQTFALGVREPTDESANSGFGVAFIRGAEGETAEYYYYLYEREDESDNFVYFEEDVDQTIKGPIDMVNGNFIKDVCGVRKDNGNKECWYGDNDLGPGNDVYGVVTFERPRPNADIYRYRKAGTGNGAQTNSIVKYRNIEIVVESPRGREQSIVVESTGQISSGVYEE